MAAVNSFRNIYKVASGVSEYRGEPPSLTGIEGSPIPHGFRGEPRPSQVSGGAPSLTGFEGRDRKSTRLNSSHSAKSRMPSSA